MHFKAEAEAERVRIRERLEQERMVFNSAAPHDEQAAHWFTPASRHRHVAAAYELGLAKLHGQGCVRDLDEGYGLLEFEIPAQPLRIRGFWSLVFSCHARPTVT